MNQCQLVLSRLKKTSLTAKDVIPDGIFRLAARVKDLREAGHDIQTTIETGQNQYGNTVKYARYWLK